MMRLSKFSKSSSLFQVIRNFTAQVIVECIRPRSFVTPLAFALWVQIDHKPNLKSY